MKKQPSNKFSWNKKTLVQNNIFLSMIEWIYQASIQSLNREQVPQATKTIVQDCANQWLSSVAEY